MWRSSGFFEINRFSPLDYQPVSTGLCQVFGTLSTFSIPLSCQDGELRTSRPQRIAGEGLIWGDFMDPEAPRRKGAGMRAFRAGAVFRQGLDAELGNMNEWK